MKKLLCFVVVALLVMGMATCAFATATATGTGGSTGLGTVKTYTAINTGGAVTTQLIPVTTIIPGKCEVVGWSCNVLSTQSDGLFSVRDAIEGTTASTDSYIISENEATNTVPVTVMLPKGLGVSRGVTIHQGQNTSVTVYYVQVRP